MFCQHVLRQIPLLLSLLHVACSAPPAPGETAGFGSVELPLTTEVNGRTFQLTNAQFRISGDAERQVDVVEQSESSVLEESLPTGKYTIELLEGWSLVEISADGEAPLLASLESLNPAPFTIEDGRATQVLFRFAVRAPKQAEEGAVRVELDVEWRARNAVFFSEIMKNPKSVSDTKGEWLELSNGGDSTFGLQGCTISRDTQSFTISNELVLEPGSAVAFANGETPGFKPDEVYKGITLPNSGEFLLQLSCGGNLIDEVLVSAATFPNVNGASLNLSNTRWSVEGNDNADAWCPGSTVYDGDDLGTPGEGNPPCPAE